MLAGSMKPMLLQIYTTPLCDLTDECKIPAIRGSKDEPNLKHFQGLSRGYNLITVKGSEPDLAG